MDIIRDYSVFDPLIYLQEYYSGMPPENREHLRFLVDACRDLPHGCRVLDFGGGPTLYSLIPAAEKAGEIHYSEYLPANRAEVQKWLEDDPSAFDWRETIQTVLMLESGDTRVNIPPSLIEARSALIRARVTQILPCDATRQSPVEGAAPPYDVIISNLCLEAVANDLDEYQDYMRSLAGLLHPGGRLVMVASKGTKTYGVGKTAFPVLYLLEPDVIAALAFAGFLPGSIQISSIPADHPVHPYQGLMCIVAQKG